MNKEQDVLIMYILNAMCSKCKQFMHTTFFTHVTLAWFRFDLVDHNKKVGSIYILPVRMHCGHQAKMAEKDAKKNTNGHKTLTKLRK